MGQSSSSSSSTKKQDKTVEVDATEFVEPDYHEVEFCEPCGGEEETLLLHDKKKKCEKNPEHNAFIAVSEFSLQHLPEGYRDQLFLDFIMSLISLTVRVVVDHVSGKRPDNYPMTEMKDKNVRSFGSGRVGYLYRKFKDTDGGTRSCPCPQCRQMIEEERSKQWGMYGVFASQHVVFDDKEAKHTQVDVDYNNETDRDTCPKLHGWGIAFEEDKWCMLCVVSHDAEVCHMLEERLDRYKDLRNKVEAKYKECGEFDKTPIVCVSHPHGMSKHVSVGEYSGDQGYPHKWRYTPSTCPGCSGAPVCSLGEVRVK